MIVVVRHGRTASNASGLLVGHADPALDELGIVQAELLANAVGPIDALIASPLLRTRQTAAAFTALGGPEAVIDERFIELDYGEWDGLELAAVSAESWATWRNDVDFAPPGGESLRVLGERVGSGLDDLAQQWAGRTVVVVTHVSPVKAALIWALGGEQSMSWRAYVAPASITRVDSVDGARRLVSFNECGHLSR